MMKIRMNMILAILITFCLTASVFMAIPIESQSTKTYNPLADINEDGKVSLADLVLLAEAYGTNGTPVNMTALLNEVDSLNSTVVALQSEVQTLTGILFNYGLIGYWKLDEGTGNTVLDSSNHGNNGTIYGATWTNGKHGNALSFDGIENYVDLGYLNVAGLTSITVSAWINSSLQQIGYIFYNGGSGEFLLSNGQQAYDQPEIVSNNTAGFSVHLDNGIMREVYSNPMTPNNWHLVTGVWTRGQSIKIYVDGILSGENDSIPNNSLLAPQNGYYTRIGCYGTDRKLPLFQGSVEDVAVYNRALSAEEIVNFYQIPPP